MSENHFTHLPTASHQAREPFNPLCLCWKLLHLTSQGTPLSPPEVPNPHEILWQVAPFGWAPSFLQYISGCTKQCPTLVVPNIWYHLAKTSCRSCNVGMRLFIHLQQSVGSAQSESDLSSMQSSKKASVTLRTQGLTWIKYDWVNDLKHTNSRTDWWIDPSEQLGLGMASGPCLAPCCLQRFSRACVTGWGCLVTHLPTAAESFCISWLIPAAFQPTNFGPISGLSPWDVSI